MDANAAILRIDRLGHHHDLTPWTSLHGLHRDAGFAGDPPVRFAPEAIAERRERGNAHAPELDATGAQPETGQRTTNTPRLGGETAGEGPERQRVSLPHQLGPPGRELGGAAAKVPTRRMPDWAVRLLAPVNPTVRAIVPFLGSKRQFSAATAEADLGWRPRPAKETILDTARSLQAAGAA